MTQLIYNNEDITKEINIKKCVIHDNAGDGADDVGIVFPDGDKLWSKWKPKRGDTVIVKSDSLTTGLMYVDGTSQDAGLFTINAISTPLSVKRPKTRIWRNIRFTEIITDIANANSLKPTLYGVSDYAYNAISQFNQSDIDFLNNICIREGCCCKVTDGNLVVFNEKYIESLESTTKLTPEDVEPNYTFSISDSLYQRFTVLYSVPFGETIYYTSFDNEIIGASGRKIEYLSSIAEAERWSKCYLRYNNKFQKTAWLPMKQASDIAAGSVLYLEKFGAYDGKYYVYKVSHDTVNNKSYLNLRQPLSKY